MKTLSEMNKTELEETIKWAEKEIAEWQKFLKEVKGYHLEKSIREGG